MNFFSTYFWIQIITSMLSAAGFAVVFKARARHLPFVAVGGLITYACYYTVAFFAGQLFLAAFFSTLLTAVYSEFCARVRRAPAAVFLFPSLIPTVPGGSLYHAMRCLLSDNAALAVSYLSDAVKIGLGIAGGIMVVSIAMGQLADIKRNRRLHESPKKEIGE